MDALEITPALVDAIRVGAEWIKVRAYRPLAIAIGGGNAVDGIEAYDVAQHVWLYLIASDVHGIRTNGRVLTPEQIEAERLEAEAAEEAKFERHYRIGRKGYEKALAKQKGFCAECRVDLTTEPYCHWDDKRGLLCRGCSPYAHRY